MRFGKVGLIIMMLSLSLLGMPPVAEVQQAAKVPRIGYLGTSSASAVPHVLDAFRQGLRELGYLEGQNIVIEYRWAEGRSERLPGLAAELVRLNVDVIVAPNTQAALAAKNATRTIPIVFAGVADPAGTGLIASVARPGGNVTGLSFLSPELGAKQLELLKEAVPKASRIAVLWNPGNPGLALTLRETEVAAKALAVQLQIREARGPNEIDSAFSAMTRERPGALLVLGDAVFLLHRTRLADLATRSRLPAMYNFREFVDAGGLMAYAANLADLFRRAAAYVDKILKGAKPPDLPVEQPMKFELVVNLKTAKALGLTIPQSVLIRADHVIE
jgi:putative ABC transport system substrate-binding protein